MMHIFQTRIDNEDRQTLLAKIAAFLQSENFHQIATLNPEILLRARRDRYFRTTLNRCDLNVADGIGLHLAAWRRGERLKGRATGADLTEYLLRYAEQHGRRVFCVVWQGGLSDWERLRETLAKRYPKLSVSGINTAKTITLKKLPVEAKRELFASHIVLCNFGAPHQENFLRSLRTTSGDIRIAIGVGGSFDFLTGALPRAPKFMRAIGLEWLWRFSRQPWRWKRMLQAVILFPLIVLFTRHHSSNI